MKSQKLDDNVREALTKACDILAEYADTVQIFITLHDHEGDFTDAWEHGIGNLLAREMQVRKWIACDMLDNERDSGEGQAD